MAKIDKTQIVVALISGLFGMMTSITPIIVTNLVQRQPQPIVAQSDIREMEVQKAPMIPQQLEQTKSTLSVIEEPRAESRVYIKEHRILENLLNNMWIVVLATVFSIIIGTFILHIKRKR